VTRRRIVNVLQKEWRVIVATRSNLLFLTLFPLLLIGQALFVIWLISRFVGGPALEAGMVQNAMENVARPLPEVATLTPPRQFVVLLLGQFNFFLLLIPAMIANVFATLSIVEEKLTRSLEPLLATPVRTWELLLGKAFSGAIPALLVTWVCAGVFWASAVGLGWGPLLRFVVTPTWWLVLLLLTPVMTGLSFLIGVVGSSRAKDVKGAQNMAVIVVLPVFAIIVVQVTGVLWFTPLLTLAFALGLLLLDAALLYLAVRLFQRETIVVRWR
jgi:ABC-2 type transport system permease protein